MWDVISEAIVCTDIKSGSIPLVPPCPGYPGIITSLSYWEARWAPTNFVKLNDDATSAMGPASRLPNFLKTCVARTINKDSEAMRKVLRPAIKRRHASKETTRPVSFPDFITAAISDDTGAAGYHKHLLSFCWRTYP